MTYLSKLHNLEMKKDWLVALELLEKRVTQNKSDYEAYIRLLFLLWYLLLEVDYQKLNSSEKDLEIKLRKYFEESVTLHSDKTDYLFYVGYIMQISEWFFESTKLKDGTKKSKEMLKKAFSQAPNNLLYEWGYSISIGSLTRAQQIALKIKSAYKEGTFNDFLNRGLMGKYFEEIVFSSISMNSI